MRCQYVPLTTVRTAPGFWTRSAFTTWNTSTTPSVLQRSMVVAMEQNIPERQTVSLYSERKALRIMGVPQKLHTHKKREPMNMRCTTQTACFQYRSSHPCLYRSGHAGTAYLQWMATGWFPVLRCTLPTSSMTSVTVLRLLQWPLGAQLTM